MPGAQGAQSSDVRGHAHRRSPGQTIWLRANRHIQNGDPDIGMLERTLDLEKKGRVDAALVGIWQGVQRDLRRKYPPQSD